MCITPITPNQSWSLPRNVKKRWRRKVDIQRKKFEGKVNHQEENGGAIPAKVPQSTTIPCNCMTVIVGYLRITRKEKQPPVLWGGANTNMKKTSQVIRTPAVQNTSAPAFGHSFPMVSPCFLQPGIPTREPQVPTVKVPSMEPNATPMKRSIFLGEWLVYDYYPLVN